MKNIRLSSGTVWSDNEELEPLFNFLDTHKDLLYGSLLYEELIDAFVDASENVTDFKNEKEEEIQELKEELEE